jgi:iron complex outermembrane recepter protein
MTNSSRALRQAVRLALTTAAASAAPLAFAQTAPAEQAAPAVQEVVVTGSRLLQQPNDISVSPITSVSQDDIQKTGLVRVEDILGNLPQVGAEQNQGTSISATGTATISLRNLGSQRTLVLINNRRMGPGGAGGFAGNANAPDLNQIPAGLIERVDVLTGGASAVYGADAVAGVVNFVMNTHYQGVKINAGYGWNNHSNDNQTYLGFLDAAQIANPPSTVNTGQNRNIDFIAGSNFADGKGNATVYATFFHANPAVGYQFDHAACTLNGGSTPNSALHCGGSGTSAHGQWVELGQVLQGGKMVTTTVADTTIAQPGGGMIPYNDTRDAYNYGALSYFQRAADRWTAGAFFHYDLNQHATVYSETMWSRNTSTAQYGPSGSFFNIVNLGCPGTATSTPLNTNPFIAATPGATAALCSPANIAANQLYFPANAGTNNINLYLARRSVESGGRQDNYFSESLRQVVGTKGEINDAWSYDVYGQVSFSTLNDIEGNFLSNNNINNALQVVGASPATATCISGPPCVPWNVWQPLAANAVTQDQLNYLEIPAIFNTHTTEYIADGLITGDLGKYGLTLPTAKDGLTLAVGSQYRSEEFVYSPDTVYQNGLAAGGAPSLPINGYFHLWEGYTEMRLPIADDKPFAYRLSLDAGYRYSSYTLGFNTNTYKIGLEWAPIQDLRFRGGYNRAVRVPNIDELFAPAAIGAGGTVDPCWGPAPVLTQAECALTGVSASRYGHLTVNSAAQINTKFYGNTNLTPEKADTYTLGLVFQPSFIPNFVMSLDAFNIKIQNTITSLSPTAIVYNCALGFDPTACGRITRTPGNQSLWLATSGFVDTSEENVGYNKTNGADVTGHYSLAMGSAGKIAFNLVGTYVHEFILQTSPGGGAYDCVGHFGVNCLAPLPKWRHTFTTDWATPWLGFDVLLRWRYIGSTTTDRTSDAPLLKAPYYPSTATIAAYNYIDLAGSIPIGSNVEVRAGVNNIADKNPPLILNGALSDCPNTTCNDNTWVGTYDTIGRYIYFNVTAQF